MNQTERTLLQAISEDREAMRELSRAATMEKREAILLRLGREHDLPVTPETMTAFQSIPQRELTDQELEHVVGGKSLSGDTWRPLGIWNDTLHGTNEKDSIRGGAGSDTLYGGGGNDFMYGNGLTGDTPDGDDYMDGGAGDDRMFGGAGNDTMLGGTGNDTMNGENGDDYMDGGEGYDYIDGGEGNDHMDGGEGNDHMRGGEGNDTMDGGDGNDYLYGGDGDDLLTGGAGSDVFAFGKNDGTDIITDFNPQEDHFSFFDNISRADLVASCHGGNTYVSFRDTSVILKGVEMTADEIWACRVE